MHQHTNQHNLQPSYTASVILDLGPNAGALFIHTGPEDLHREIEISPADEPRTRTHAAVRERHLPTATLYTAVYPALPPGLYTIWADAQTPAATITITSAQITEHHWPNAKGLGSPG